jgi:serine/threonine-protein kinase HipA
MVTHANVLLWGQTVGLVIWDDRLHRAQFQYDRDFAKRQTERGAVDDAALKSQGGDEVFSFGNLRDETFKGLPGLLADCLPDRFGEPVAECLATKQNRDLGTENPVERLCYLGHRGMGALEFEPAHHELEASSETLQIDELVRMATSVL